MSKEEKQQKILIVDDKKQNISLLMEIFKDDYKIAAALDADKALDIVCSDSPPDLVLSDIMMPGKDGYELCREIKENDLTKHIPVIFVTAVSEVMDEAKGFAVGGVDYITKPFHPPMVKARVELHMELQRKQKLLESMAFIDALTEIPNRRRFDDIIEREWKRSLRSKQKLSVVVMDIDHFKLYNDNNGHGKGDECLRKVASQLANTLRRAGDFVARIGGEEFAAVLPYSDVDDATALAEGVMETMGRMALPHPDSPVADHITLSLGVASMQPREDMEPAFLLEKADEALYQAKRSGRNTFRAANL